MKSSVLRGIVATNDGGVAAAALDLSHDLIVVLDSDGTIVLTNAAWRAGADRRGAADAATGRGANYLEVCERGDAAAVAAGIRAVLLGDLPRFESDYSGHSRLEDAWYSLEVLPLGEPGVGVVVTHTNITARVAASRPHRHGRDLDPVTMLPTSPAGVKGLAHVLAHAQSSDNSLAVVTVTLSDIGDIEWRHGRRSRDEVVVQVLARIRRLIRADDVIYRTSTNQLVVVASVADARSGEYLRTRISDVLQIAFLVGADDIEAHVVVTVTSSDQFSTLDSLLPGYSGTPSQPPHDDPTALSNDVDIDESTGDENTVDGGTVDGGTVDGDASRLPLMVYSLPDGYLMAANEGARSLFGLETSGPDPTHVRDIIDPIDLRHTTVALSALSSGVTDSYRAQRTLVTADGPLVLLTSVRRLVLDRGAFAVILTVPAQQDEAAVPATEDPFAAALVAGTIDADGAVLDVSAPGSPMEAELVGALGATLTQAAHPDEVDGVAALLETMRVSGRASGAFRVPHAVHGWVVCQCQLFTIRRRTDRPSNGDSPVADRETFGFVLSANASTKSMFDRIARLERHIRRIGSEVSAADLEFGGRPSADHAVTEALDVLAPTARQRDIVERLARGQRVSVIASELYISRSTVRNHLAQVYRLAGVHSQDELLDSLRRRSVGATPE